MAIYDSRSRIILIITAFLFTTCGENTAPTSVDGEPNGKAIYNQNCKVCHGGNGSLGIGGAADLSISQKSFEEKLYIITNGSESGKMTSFKRVLIEKEIDAVTKYIETLKK